MKSFRRQQCWDDILLHRRDRWMTWYGNHDSSLMPVSIYSLCVSFCVSTPVVFPGGLVQEVRHPHGQQQCRCLATFTFTVQWREWEGTSENASHHCPHVKTHAGKKIILEKFHIHNGGIRKQKKTSVFWNFLSSWLVTRAQDVWGTNLKQTNTNFVASCRTPGTSALDVWMTRRCSVTTRSAFLSTRISRRRFAVSLTLWCTDCWQLLLVKKDDLEMPSNFLLGAESDGTQNAPCFIHVPRLFHKRIFLLQVCVNLRQAAKAPSRDRLNTATTRSTPRSAYRRCPASCTLLFSWRLGPRSCCEHCGCATCVRMWDHVQPVSHTKNTEILVSDFHLISRL